MRVGLLVAVLFLAACNTIQNEENSLIRYGCNEVVVIGRAKTLGYSDISDEDDVLGRGAFDMEIAIKRVLYGKEPRRAIRAYGIAHAQIREDKDFAFVLTPRDEGFEVRSGYLWNGWPKPRLADSCEQS